MRAGASSQERIPVHVIGFQKQRLVSCDQREHGPFQENSVATKHPFRGHRPKRRQCRYETGYEFALFHHNVRFFVKYPRQERGALAAHDGICAAAPGNQCPYRDRYPIVTQEISTAT